MNGLLRFALAALLICAGCGKQRDANSALRVASVSTLSSFDPPRADEKTFPEHAVKFEETDLDQVLNLYAEVSHRSIIRSANLPQVKITFSNQTPMSSVELLQALDTVLAAQAIAMVYQGTQYVKAVAVRDLSMESPPIIDLEPNQLPDSGSVLMYIVRLKNITPDQTVSAIQPFARLPNSIIAPRIANRSAGAKASLPQPLDKMLTPKDKNIIILRDYSSNVRRMLQVIEKLEEQ